MESPNESTVTGLLLDSAATQNLFKLLVLVVHKSPALKDVRDVATKTRTTQSR